MKTKSLLSTCAHIGCALFLITGFAITTLAGQYVRPAPPNLSMIKSVGLLWSYADSQAAEASWRAYGDTVLNDWGRTSVSAKLPIPENGSFVGDAQKLVGLINRQGLYFRVSSPRGNFGYYGSIVNTKGRQLFYTSGSTKLVQDYYGDYRLDDNAQNSVWGLVPVVPIAYAGAQSAKVVVSDAAGNLQTSYLDVSDGFIGFPTNLVDRVGDLVVTRTVEGQDQPETVGYDLRTGMPKPLSYVFTSANGYFEKLLNWQISAADAPWRFIGGWGFGQADFVMIFDVAPRSEPWSLEVDRIEGGYANYAVGLVIRAADDVGFERVKYLQLDQNPSPQPVKISLPEGKWHVVPIWPGDPYRYYYPQWWP